MPPYRKRYSAARKQYRNKRRRTTKRNYKRKEKQSVVRPRFKSGVAGAGKTRSVWVEANAWLGWDEKVSPQAAFKVAVAPYNATAPFNVATDGYSDVKMLYPASATPVMSANGYKGLNRWIQGGQASGSQPKFETMYQVEKYIVDWEIVSRNASSYATGSPNPCHWIVTTNQQMFYNGQFQTIGAGSTFGAYQQCPPVSSKIIPGGVPNTVRLRHKVDVPTAMSMTRAKWLNNNVFQCSGGAVAASGVLCYLHMHPAAGVASPAPNDFMIRIRIRAKIHLSFPSGYIVNQALDN